MKRSTPLRRTPFKAKAASAPDRATAAVKPKTCAKSKGGCGAKFIPARPMQCACDVQCAQNMGALKNAKAAKKAAADDKRQTRAKLEDMKTLPELLAEAQREFNRFIRFRDADKPCICCGQPLGDQRFGGAYDAGHYRSVGSAPHLRFDERNVHAQRKVCNNHKAGNHVEYRAGLIAREGLDLVEALEADQTPRKYTRDQVREIRNHYRKAANELAKRVQEREEACA